MKIPEIDTLLDCYQTVSLGVPLVERQSVLKWLEQQIAASFNLPIYLWNLATNGYNQISWDERKQNFNFSRLVKFEEQETFQRATSALTFCHDCSQSGIFILENIQSLISQEARDIQQQEIIKCWLINTIDQLRVSENKYLILLNTFEVELPRILKTIIPSVYQPLPDLAEVTELLKKILPAAGLLQPGEEIKQELAQAVSGLSVEEIKMGVRLVASRRRQMGGWGDRGMGRWGDTLDNVGTRRNGDTFDDAGTRRRGDNFDDTGTRRRGDAERNLENIFTSTETISPHPPITQSPSLPVHHQKHSNSSHLPIPPSPHPTPYSLLPTPSQNLTPQLLDYKIERLQGLGLDFIPKPNVSNFGGLDRLKQGIEEVRADFSAKARTYNIPLPKGWLLVGPPGTGKTFAAKVCAYNLGFPLISVGVDAVMSGGAAYLKRLLRRIEACSPAVCYFDEFDKFFTANRATGEDSQSKQVLGVLLTWLQEKRSPVFVIATLNRLDALPPELTRAGRFDKIYYVGFPQANERQEIFQLHASRFDKRYLSGDSPLTEREWKILLGKTVNCTGAEIRSIIESAARKLFHQGLPLVIGLSELLEQREGMIPLYARDTERVLAMENRAKYVAEPASSLDQSVFAPPVTSYWGD